MVSSTSIVTHRLESDRGRRIESRLKIFLLSDFFLEDGDQTSQMASDRQVAGERERVVDSKYHRSHCRRSDPAVGEALSDAIVVDHDPPIIGTFDFLFATCSLAF